ncbi:MAG: glycosyltransferase family 2 protein [Cytophagales bacterium]|nr:MAG: glycosyltransferase family 2 protein [Cytophagales bacterium]
MIIINTILAFLFSYFLFYICYFLFYSIAGLFFPKNKLLYQSHPHKAKFLVLIPSYKEDEIILSTAAKAIAHDYPSDRFEVAVIADKLQAATIEKLKAMNLRLVEVNFEVSTKAKSINKALEVLPSDYDYVMILDSDNIMAAQCLERINHAMQKGFKVVQGHRTAKNKNTNFAILDGISEEINNHIFRIGHRAVGLSSALIGSGMAFEYNYYKKMMYGNEAMGGEDREAELRIFKDRLTIEYAANADIYDEKVQNPEVFAKQRTRWIAGQFYFFKVHGMEGLRQLIKGNIDFFNKVLQTLIPPRVILIGALPLLAFVSYFLGLSISAAQWAILFVLLSIAFGLAIPKKYYNKELIFALLQLPSAILHLIKGILKIGKAHQTNFHTPHTTKDIQE